MHLNADRTHGLLIPRIEKGEGSLFYFFPKNNIYLSHYSCYLQNTNNNSISFRLIMRILTDEYFKMYWNAVITSILSELQI